MSWCLAIFAIFHLLLCSTKGENVGVDDFFKVCPPSQCGDKGPLIRFPFRLHSQPSSCGLKGYELSCSGSTTLLNLPSGGNLSVRAINYTGGFITTDGGDSWSECPLQGLLSLNFTNSVFSPNLGVLSLVSCPTNISWTAPKWIQQWVAGPITCLSNAPNQLIYLAAEFVSVDLLPDVCTKISDVKSNGYSSLYSNLFVELQCKFSCTVDKLMKAREVVLGYSLDIANSCKKCEEIGHGHFCGFNQTTNNTVCVQYYHRSYIALIAGASVTGAVLVITLILFIVIYITKRSVKEKELRLKIETFLAGYNTTKPTRYTLTELRKITKKFKCKLGQGGFGSVYKGELPNGIPVAVKLLETSTANGDEFINEVATIGRIHHFNIVRLLGFCSEGTHRALVYEFMPNDSLEKYIFLKENRTTHRKLSFRKLHEIAFGVARGMEYLHQGCNQRILHFDIKPHNILLDGNFSPKISNFGLAKLCSKDQSMVTMTAMRGTTGYIAPEIYSRSFGMVSYKSDVYSFGMLLLEMVGGRKNIDLTVENSSAIYFPKWAYDKLVQGEDLEEVVEVEGNDREIVKKLAIVALWCVQCNPADRPSMTRVIHMIEGDLQSLSMPPNPFALLGD